MKILLLGKNGQVGWELQCSLAPLGELIALDRYSTDYCGSRKLWQNKAQDDKKGGEINAALIMKLGDRKIDAFVSRFARLQDFLGEKLIPVFASLLGENPKSMLDVLGDEIY